MRLFLYILLAALSDPSAFSFRNIGVEQGLSSNTVSSVCQDRQGNMWFATKGGVNCYNGYDVDVYRYGSDDVNTVQSNNINRVFTDWEGTVWACSSDGISRFDRNGNCFRRVDLPGIHSVEDMLQIAPCRYLVCTRTKSFIYDSSGGRLEDATIDGQPFCFFGHCYGNGQLLLGTDKKTLEFVKYDPDSGFARVRDGIRLNSLVSDIVPAGEDSWWLGTRGEGLFLCEKGRVSRIELKNLPRPVVESVECDSDSLVWIGTKFGLCIYDRRSGEDILLSSDPFEAGTLGSKAIRDIFRDSSGNMWVGSTYGGADLMCAQRSPFHTLRPHPGRNSLSDNIIRSLHADGDSCIWIGTRYNGLNCFHPATGRIDVIPDLEHILCFLSPGDGPLYIGTYSQGIYALDRRSGRRRSVCKGKDVNAMAEAEDGRIWVGSLSGLYLLDPASGSMKKRNLFEDRRKVRVVCLMRDSRGRLWVGAKENLLLCEVDGKNRLREVGGPELLDVVRSQCLYESRDSTVWIGTTDGLLRYRDGELRRASAESGLRNVTINGIESDSEGFLWVSTSHGLCRYDPKESTGKFYYADDGLQGDEFSQGAICSSPDGTVYVGGYDGLSYFRPEEIRENPVSPDPYITHIRVHNEEIPLKDRIVLKHSQDAITICFSCTDYASAGHNSFRYKLEGFSRDWTESSSREAKYTNVDKGNYCFRVRSANRDGVWSEHEATLNIRVKPVWYRSLAARIFFILLLLASLSLLTLKLLRRNEARHAARMDRMKEKYEQDMRRLRVAAYLPKGKAGGPEESEFLFSVLSIIEENLGDPDFSVEKLASLLCMSRSNLHLKLHNITGSGALELIRSMRMEKARSLLREGKSSVTEVAELCGFSSLSYFSTVFRKECGLSPGEYASKVKG